jgi:tetratricopeptide (TPR) repeat protein
VTVAEGRVLLAERQYQAALAAQRRALAIKEQALGPDHPETLSSLANVAMALQESGDQKAALEANRRALEVVERVLGGDHPMASLVRNNLGEVLNSLGRFGEARPVFEQAIAGWRHAGSDPYLVAYGLTGLGLAWLGEGHAAEAQAPLEQALRIRTEKHVDAQQLGEVRFALARALAHHPGGRERAHALARAARADYAQANDARAVASVDGWLAKQPDHRGHGTI